METVFYQFVPSCEVLSYVVCILKAVHMLLQPVLLSLATIILVHHCSVLQNVLVVFFYVWPEDLNDNRRWLTGLVQSGELETDNLHNHPLHNETKIPVKVDSDIRRAIIENPHLKTSNLITVLVHSFIHY